MADAIDHNADKSEFGGAAVIVPPKDGGAPVELFVMRTADPIVFWKTLMDKVKEVLEEQEHARKMGGQGGFRR